jgi:hypothetical protein
MNFPDHIVDGAILLLSLLLYGRSQEQTNFFRRFSRLFEHLFGSCSTKLSIVSCHGISAGEERTDFAASTRLSGWNIVVWAKMVVVFHLLSTQVAHERFAEAARHLVAAVALDKWCTTGRFRATAGHGLCHGLLSSLMGIGHAPLRVGDLSTGFTLMIQFVALDTIHRIAKFAVDGQIPWLQHTKVGTRRTFPVLLDKWLSVVTAKSTCRAR